MQPEQTPRSINASPRNKKLTIIIVSIITGLLFIGGIVTTIILLSNNNKEAEPVAQNEPTNPIEKSQPKPTEKPAPTTPSKSTEQSTANAEKEIRQIAEQYVAAVNARDEKKARELSCDPMNPGIMYTSAAPNKAKVTLNDQPAVIVGNKDAQVYTQVIVGEASPIDFPINLSLKNNRWCVSF